MFGRRGREKEGHSHGYSVLSNTRQNAFEHHAKHIHIVIWHEWVDTKIGSAFSIVFHSEGFPCKSSRRAIATVSVYLLISQICEKKGISPHAVELSASICVLLICTSR